MAKKKSLLEGFSATAGKAVRSYFARELDQGPGAIIRGGSPGAERAGAPIAMTNQFGFDGLGEHLRVDQDLHSRYVDAEAMDDTSEITAGLDIYADDCTSQSLEEQRSIWAVSENKEVQTDLNNTLHKTILVEDDVWGNSRTVAKYGNNFGENLVTERGLVGIRYLPPPTVRRIEDPYGVLLGFVQDVRGDFNLSIEDFYRLAELRDKPTGRRPGEMTVFEDWELTHWRLRGKHMRSVYGHGVIDPARHIFKRLQLLEDAALIYKLERAPARFAFYVDVGQMDSERGLAFLNRVKSQHTRKRYISPITGQLDARYNPLASDEDFWVAVRDGKRSTEIDVLSGPDYSDTEVLDYHLNKLSTAIKIPKSYMGRDGEATKGALSSEDIRFAKTVIRVQQEIRRGYKKSMRVHMIAQGRDPSKNDYDIRMNVPNSIMELAKIEVLSATADLATRMGEHIPTRLILTSLFKYSEDEAAEIMKERQEDQVRKAKMEKIVTDITQPPEQPPQAQQQPSEAAMVEARLSRVIKTVRHDWEREFEGKRRNDRALNDKLEQLLARDAKAVKRMHNISGLLQDIRGAMRPVA